MKTLIYLTGPMGSGKSTLARSMNSSVLIELENELISDVHAAEISFNKDKPGPVIIVQQSYTDFTIQYLQELAQELGYYFYDIALKRKEPVKNEESLYDIGFRVAAQLIKDGKAPEEVLKIKSCNRHLPFYNMGWTAACSKNNNKINSEFLRGYADAKSVLLKGAKVDSIIRPFEENVNYTQFDLGWNKACEDFRPLLKPNNILAQADAIVNGRSEEKERQYGPFEDSMDNMRDIFNAITGLDLKTEHMYKAMIAAKLSRERFSHKEDNLLDLCAYTGSLNNYIENQAVKK